MIKEQVLKILVKDSLYYNNLSLTDQTLDSIVEFCSSKFSCLFVESNKCRVLKQYIADSNDKLVFEENRYDDYLTTTAEFSYVAEFVVSENINEIAMNNFIPMNRLTNDYDDLWFMNEQYIEKCHKLFGELTSVVEYLQKNNMITDLKETNSQYKNLIKEFISNELNS